MPTMPKFTVLLSMTERGFNRLTPNVQDALISGVMAVVTSVTVLWIPAVVAFVLIPWLRG